MRCLLVETPTHCGHLSELKRGRVLLWFNSTKGKQNKSLLRRVIAFNNQFYKTVRQQKPYVTISEVNTQKHLHEHVDKAATLAVGLNWSNNHLLDNAFESHVCGNYSRRAVLTRGG